MRIYSIRKGLNIQEYKITGILSEMDKEIHIKLEPYKRKPFICSGCGRVHKIGYHGREESVVEDLPMFEKRVYLHVIKRRHKCPIDNRIYIEEVPWLKKWGRVTKRFAEKVNRLTAITTNQEAGWFLGLDDEAVYRIDKEMLEEQYAKKLVPPPAGINLSIDEVSYRKYHRYLTNVVDTDIKAVIWNDRGRRREVLDRYYTAIGEDNCKTIESVALDGARNYINSSSRYAVNALIVYDKFHVMQKLNWAVDMVRKQELRKARKDENKELVELMHCRQRFVLLKRKDKLTPTQASHLERLCRINEPIYKAMLLKESFLKVYDYNDSRRAEKYLRAWIKDALASSLDVFKKIAESFLDKIQYIINWFKKKISSAISEGINNKIKRLKRMAYGYKDIDYFKLKIHQHCGLLNPRKYPH